eukprot:9417561-Pyramimonas_sp.AAC.1
MDFKVATPPAAAGGFRPIGAETKGKKQCVCDRPELIHSRHYEVGYKALVDPSPAPEEDVMQWQIDNAITDQILLQQPRADFERATVKRQVRSLFQPTKEKEIVAEFDQLRRRHSRFLGSGDWTHRELHSDQLVTEHFDAQILVAHGLQDISTPLNLVGLPRERPDLRTMDMDESMPRISVNDWMLFRNKKKEGNTRNI